MLSAACQTFTTKDTCLFCELAQAGLHFEYQVRLPVMYNGISLPAACRVDFIVEQCLVVEVKVVEELLPVHLAQVITHLKLGRFPLGLLINFNAPRLRQGIRRVINGPQRGF